VSGELSGRVTTLAMATMRDPTP
jgi:hypothetical protein